MEQPENIEHDEDWVYLKSLFQIFVTSVVIMQKCDYVHSLFTHKTNGILFQGSKQVWALNRRLISGVWTVNSPQSHIVRVYDAGHGKSGVFHSAEWHDGDWSSDGIREAWLWFFIWVESF
ncbi:hypothetical protein TNCV_4789261 [Trichonephila clavipes]|nr:hypothetical protein TNCV_4789261 [Trichonephila clavipes]